MPVNQTTCVINHERYLVQEGRTGTGLCALDQVGGPIEWFDNADLLDVVSILYKRAAEGKRILRETAV